MSWHFSQALVEEYSVANFSDGAPSVPLNETPMPLAYLCSDRMTAFSAPSLSGMTFAPLTADRGEALLTWFLAGFPAKTLVVQGPVQELKAKDKDFGEKWRGSFARYSQDLSSWKTHQFSLLGDLEGFSETWPRWGLMLGGECFQQRMLEHDTSANASGFWPTPCKTDGLKVVCKTTMGCGSDQRSSSGRRTDGFVRRCTNS